MPARPIASRLGTVQSGREVRTIQLGTSLEYQAISQTTETTMRRMVRLLVATSRWRAGWCSRLPRQPPSRRAIRESSGRFKRSESRGTAPGPLLSPIGRAGMRFLTPCSSDLRDYGKAASETDRLAALDPSTSSQVTGHHDLAAGGQSPGGNPPVAAAPAASGVGQAPL